MGRNIIRTGMLILINGFFVIAEFALVKVRQSQLDLKVQDGDLSARLAKTMKERMDLYLSSCQLGVTLASLALGWIGEDAMSELLHGFINNIGITLSSSTIQTLSVSVGFLIITIVHIVIGEQLPKMLGIRFSQKFMLLVAQPLYWFTIVFKPFIYMLNSLSGGIGKVFGVKNLTEERIETEEELKMVIAESEESGTINQAEHELIQNVFDFDNRLVRQIMLSYNRIIGLDLHLDQDAVIESIIREGYSRLPVYDHTIDTIIGIVHTKDIFASQVRNKKWSLQQLMRQPHFIPETMPVNQLLADFQRLHTQMAIVTDEFGATSGLVTLEDILEELVGDIQDEHDEETNDDIQKIGEEEWVIKTSIQIDQLNEALDIEMPETSDYTTLSGYLNTALGHIPKVRETNIINGYLITIIKSSTKRAEMVRVKKIQTQ